MPRIQRDKLELLVVGNMTVDEVYVVDKIPDEGNTALVISHQRHFGGRGGNVAVVASKLGLKVDLASIVGKDFPRNYKKEIRSLKIGTRWLETIGSSNTARFFEFRDRLFRSVSFLSPITETRGLEIGEAALRYDGVFITPFDSDLHIRDLPSVLIKRTNVFLSLGEEIYRMNKKTIELALGFSEYLLLNRNELKKLLTRTKLKGVSNIFDKVGKLRCIISTKGPRGASVYTKDSITNVPAVASNSKTDLGAGDSFAAGFIFSILKGGDLLESVKVATVTASLAIEGQSIQRANLDFGIIKRRFAEAYNKQPTLILDSAELS